MEIDPRVAAMEQWMAERADRPFGDTDRVSGLTLQPLSQASQEAASNLLEKALKALRGDDVARARQLVERAVALPYDRHEDCAPVGMAVDQMLFDAVTDGLEMAYDSSGWLEAAVDVVRSAEGQGRTSMANALRSIEQDYHLDKPERSLVRAALADVPRLPDLLDVRCEADELTERVLSVLAAVLAYRDDPRVEE